MLPIIYLNRQTIGLKTYYYENFPFNWKIYTLFSFLKNSTWDSFEKSWLINEAAFPLENILAHFKDKTEFIFQEKSLESLEYKQFHSSSNDIKSWSWLHNSHFFLRMQIQLARFFWRIEFFNNIILDVWKINNEWSIAKFNEWEKQENLILLIFLFQLKKIKTNNRNINIISNFDSIFH